MTTDTDADPVVQATVLGNPAREGTTEKVQLEVAVVFAVSLIVLAALVALEGVAAKDEMLAAARAEAATGAPSRRTDAASPARRMRGRSLSATMGASRCESVP
jgi:hypothetical protein